MTLSPSFAFGIWLVWVGGAVALPALPFVPVLCAIPLLALALWPRARRRLRAVAWVMGSLGLGLWLVHGGVLNAWLGGEPVPGRVRWAFSLWLRIFAVVSSGSSGWRPCPCRVWFVRSCPGRSRLDSVI